MQYGEPKVTFQQLVEARGELSALTAEHDQLRARVAELEARLANREQRIADLERENHEYERCNLELAETADRLELEHVQAAEKERSDGSP